ncbi:hypothetical protein H5410_025214 [Solanum commersonii]|uniref:F-box associated beta-propeller type 3 domain-containing protein n=1 Tax=Solanum commersonii TaxID=4109 RepID=A0A9J5YTM6_SOLCO|nr:hypothetical protein H5410_025214 [Solanum commersonii]
MRNYREHSLSSVRYWIFTLGTRESWREIKSIPFDSFAILPLKGYLKMATFDCRTKNYRIISLWNEHDHYSVIDIFYYNHLVEVEEKLVVVDVSRGDMGEMILRILQNSEIDEWVNQRIVFPPLLCREATKDKCCYLMKNCVCRDTLNGEIVLINSWIKPNRIFFYDLKKNNWREIEVLGLEEKENIFYTCSY